MYIPEYIAEYLNMIESNPELRGLCIFVCVLLLFIILVKSSARNKFTYTYNAATIYSLQDHKYNFVIKKSHGEYKCYIQRIPSFRNRDTSKYMPHFWTENKTGKMYICWTGKIVYPKQAKTLCRNWADATQQFIDTGRPAAGFERK